MKTIQTLSPEPFRHFCMTIGELPTSYMESMTYYEMLAWFCEYLKGTVIPAINENAQATTELQGLYTQLKEYVDNYFENLDVQNEINNKLDNMAEAGTLQEIMAEYLDTRAIFGFKSVADMKVAENLRNGSYARTLGYHQPNDGGKGLYLIREVTNQDVEDEGSIIRMQDTSLVAQLITDEANICQFGAYGDDNHDDTQAIKNAMIYAKPHGLPLTAPAGKTFDVSEPLDVNEMVVNFNGSTIYGNHTGSIFTINTTEYGGVIENIVIDAGDASNAIEIINGRKKEIRNVTINNISNCGIRFTQGYELLVHDCHLNGDGGNSSVGIIADSSDSKFENIILIDCYTGIKNNGLNYYEYIHAWIKTHALCVGSKMFDIVSNQVFCDCCYSDTYQYTFYYSGTSGTVTCDQMRVFFNQSIYEEGFEQPYVFKFNAVDNTRSSFVNSVISGVRANQKLAFADRVGIVKCNNNNLVWVTDGTYNGGLTYTPTPTGSNITSVITNSCVVKNGVMYFNILCTVDTSVSRTINFSNLPVEYRPQAQYNTSFAYGQNQWSHNGECYLFVSDKISAILPSSTSGIIYAKLVGSYPINNENY